MKSPRDHIKTFWISDQETLQKFNTVKTRWKGQKPNTALEGELEAKQIGR